MDSRLQERLDKWFNAIDELHEVELDYLSKEGREKSLEGQLFLLSDGKTVDAKKADAYSDHKWIDFKEDLAKTKANYNKTKRLLELKIKAYESEYLTYKLESEAIRKGIGTTP